MAGRLEGKTAIITGAGRGIGQAIAERYALEGAAVTVADIDGSNAEAVAAGIRSSGGRAIGLTIDVSNAAQIDSMVAATLAEFGALDVMVNNAGVVREAVRHVLEADEAWWDLIIDTNLKGHFLCSLAAAKHMAGHGGGTIITMSSGGANRAHRGMVAYDSSKGGIEAMTRALALDLAPYGIRVVGLVPGLIVPSRESTDPAALAKTDATVPIGRAGVPDDLAGPAVFLATDDARYITGSFVTVDGGVLFQQRSPQVETFPLDRYPHRP
ncbi:MAG: short-chain dehydrogenase/reductase [Ilumatobacteraceae bacterium]|nr:short-chain dehydrogenase/reductase [Ilumatobacteraceae bacterium]